MTPSRDLTNVRRAIVAAREYLAQHANETAQAQRRLAALLARERVLMGLEQAVTDTVKQGASNGRQT